MVKDAQLGFSPTGDNWNGPAPRKGPAIARLISVLALASIIDTRFAAVIAFWLVWAVVFSSFSTTKRYAATLPLALAILLAFTFVVFGMSLLWIGVFLSLAGLIVAAWRHSSIDIRSVPLAGSISTWSMSIVMMIALLVLVHLYTDEFLGRLARGDAVNWVLMQRQLVHLDALEVFTSEAFPNRSLGQPLLASLLGEALPHDARHVAQDLFDNAWLIWAALLATGSQFLSSKVLVRHHYSSLVLGVLVGATMCSGLILGLTIVNGFFSIPLGIATYALSLAATIRFQVSRSRGDFAIAVLGTLCLFLTWQFLAVTATTFLTAAVLSRGSKMRYLGIAGSLTFLAFLGVGFYVRWQGKLTTSGYFPETPVAFLITVAVLACALSRSERLRLTTATFSLAAVTGALGVALIGSTEPIVRIPGFVQVSAVTPFYYIQKYFWMSCIPMVIIAVILTYRLQLRGARKWIGPSLATFVVLAAFGASSLPVPYLPSIANQYQEREVGSELRDWSRARGQHWYFSYRTGDVTNALNMWQTVQSDTRNFVENAQRTGFVEFMTQEPSDLKYLDGRMGYVGLCRALTEVEEGALLVSTDGNTRAKLVEECSGSASRVEIQVR